MKWSLNEITKKKQIDFEEVLELAEVLKGRSKELLDATPVRVSGSVSSSDDGLYFLDYQLQTELTLPSSRSLKPVAYPLAVFVNEAFSQDKEEAENEEKLIIPLEKDLIDLDESVADNILLEIPLKVLAEDEEENEEELPAGKNWTVLSEEEYAKQQEQKAAEKKSPFDVLSNFSDD